MVEVATLESLLNESLATLLQSHADLITTGVSERTLCARLALELEKRLGDYGLAGTYYADVEYNRKQGGRVKTILDGQERVVAITCDLILHSRGKLIRDDNLIAIEMKKSSGSKADKESDRNRLRALTKESYDGIWSADGITRPEHVCGYKLGLYMELDIRARKCLLEYYRRGCLQRTAEMDF